MGTDNLPYEKQALATNDGTSEILSETITIIYN